MLKISSPVSSVRLEELKQKAFELGFDDVGITDPSIPEEDIKSYLEWLKNNHHADLAYMENTLRTTPEKLFPGAQTAIIFVSYYKQDPKPLVKEAGLIAAYARGKKYQNVHHSRLKKFIRWLEERSGQTQIAKAFSDTTPIMEKALAVKAGLGWFGKNTLLIHRKFGTFTLLSGILTTLNIEGRTLAMRLPRCGSCTRCMDACPTGALIEPYKLDAAKCLSYHLIESKKEIPPEIQNKNPGYLFGCDICQDSCPHNFRKQPSDFKELREDQGMGAYLTLTDLKNLEKTPEKLFGTPLQRQGVTRLKATSALLLEK